MSIKEEITKRAGIRKFDGTGNKGGNLDGSGMGDCLNNTPEENKKKFDGNYRKFFKAVLNKHGGKLTPELYKKIDKAWKGKTE